MVHLKSLIPEGLCLLCKGCCRYSESNSLWAPLFFYQEIAELSEKNILSPCLFVHRGKSRRHAARITLVKGKETFFCPCLNPQDNRCKIYENRPFDCQLYPFLLIRSAQGVFLGASTLCPYIEETISDPLIRPFVDDLKEFLESDGFMAQVVSDPAMIQTYPRDTKLLEPLPKLSAAVDGTSTSQTKG